MKAAPIKVVLDYEYWSDGSEHLVVRGVLAQDAPSPPVRDGVKPTLRQEVLVVPELPASIPAFECSPPLKKPPSTTEAQ